MNSGALSHKPVVAGLVLLASAALALGMANTPLAPFYSEAVSGRTVFVINDVLMSIFFLLVGLDIKRDFMIGDLSGRAQAMQPLLAAIGGVAVPAALYVLFNRNDPASLAGWAIPCATDIAFALGIVATLGKRVPASLVALLAAIAVIDDLFAILVIALFYSGGISVMYLAAAAVLCAVLYYMNRYAVRFIPYYLLAGMVLWYCLLKAGLHPTLAGVVTALAIPLSGGATVSPLDRLHRQLYPWVAFIIMPLFAFANAGLDIRDLALGDLRHNITGGIMLGLVAGKPLGVMGGLFLGHVTGIARKPKTMLWRHYAGIASLCGIGFTMSLFIGQLAFAGEEDMALVRLGVLLASAIMACGGWLLCRFAPLQKTDATLL